MLYPIDFCIPECKIVKGIDVKERFMATYVNTKHHDLPREYVYTSEKEYYEGYKKSVFGRTRCRAGWDCMRHYEILANGCIPWFENLEACPPQTMTHFPKDLVLESMKIANAMPKDQLYNLSNQTFTTITDALLKYTRANLTTKAMASYILKTSGNEKAKSILYFTHDSKSEYLRDLLLHGCKELIGSKCHEWPRTPYLYTDYPESEVSKLYGRGMTYTRLLDPVNYDTSKDATLIQDIENHVYDCIVYGCIYRDGIPLWDLVRKYYKTNEIIILCGEDERNCICKNTFQNTEYTLFKREL